MEEILVFVRVVDAHSISGAAVQLNMPKSTVSRRLSRLEEELEAQLVLRTPRALQLTELGQLLHARATPVLAHLDDVERSLRERGETPAGPLRVSAPPDLATAHLGPLLGTFSLDHPRVELRLVPITA